MKFDDLTIKKLLKPLLLFLAGVIGGTALFVLDLQDSELPKGYFLERPRMGQGNREEELEVHWEHGREKISVFVEEQKLSREEIREYLEQTAAGLDTWILGENPDAEHIKTPLKLPREMDGLPLSIEWSIPSESPVHSDGSLRQQELPREGVVTKLTAKLQWEEEVLLRTFYLRVYPPDITEKEQFFQALWRAVEQKGQDSGYKEQQELPRKAGDIQLSWKRPVNKRGISILLLGAAGAVFQVLAGRREAEKKEEKKRAQMEMDYPEIVSKLKLYMEAGLTCRAAWVKIAGDYQEKRKNGQARLRYAYEEMVKTGYEMQSGVGELRAYERFSDRCQAPCYKKLTGLLIQNVRKGTRGLGAMLETEMWQAFQERKSLARRQGEEAGTRLLLPMVGMLGVVMVIVIAPALMSMQM